MAYLIGIILALLPAPAPAQTLYAANQIPARGLQIEYTLNVMNPVSHISGESCVHM